MKKKLVLWLLNTKFWGSFLLKFMPYVRFSTYYTRIRGAKFMAGWEYLRPGHSVLTLDEKKASTLVPGIMSHATFCVNNCIWNGNKDYELAEMTHGNFTRSYWFDICKEADRVIIVKCDDFSLAHVDRMIELVPQFFNSIYDVRFTLGIKQLYCSELPYQLDRWAANPIATPDELNKTDLKGVMDLDLSDLVGIGVPYISPDGLLFGKNMRVVWDSDNELTGMTGPEAEAYCKKRGYIK